MGKAVFLCHSSKDKAFVTRLCRDLRKAGADLWLAEWELRVGDSLLTRISKAICQSGYLVVILSCSSIQSKWVQLELNLGLSLELQKDAVFVLPVLIEAVEPPPFLKDKVYADFTRNYDDGLRALLRRLKPVTQPPARERVHLEQLRILLFGSSDNQVVLRKMEQMLVSRGFLRTWIGDDSRPGRSFYKEWKKDYVGNEEWYLRNVLEYNSSALDDETLGIIRTLIRKKFKIRFDMVRPNDDLPADRDVSITLDRSLA